VVVLRKLDHVNIRTSRLSEMVDFYRETLGLDVGYRPPFAFPGAWLYCDDQAVVHLVGVEQVPRAIEPRIEHFAFSAVGLDAFLERLRASDIAYRIAVVPEVGTIQVKMADPDGNHLHVDFDPEETAEH